MNETTLGLLRHGQTDWNIDFRLQGTADIPMNEHGISQALAAAERLAEMRWDFVISSPLGRARETAEIVSKRLGLDLHDPEPLLLERSFGIGEGKTYEEWQQHYAGLDDIPGAESRIAIEKRARHLLDLIEARHRGARILAVSHGALIRFVLAEVSAGAIPPAGERLSNASLHILRKSVGAWSLDGWAPEPLI